MNSHIQDQLEMAEDALRYLSGQRVRVEDVRIGGRAPVIYVCGDGLQHRLIGALYMRERVHGRVVGTYVARVRGCQVRWSTSLSPCAPAAKVTRIHGGCTEVAL